MKMKKLIFTDLSSKKCSVNGCNNFLKTRLVEQKPTVDMCYKHHKQREAQRGHTIDQMPRKKRILAELPVKSY
jgi:hypothetical protein